MKKTLLLVFSLLISHFTLLANSPALAQEPPPFDLPQPQGFQITNLSTLIGAVLRLMFIAAAIIMFIMLIWGGIQWITSGGDKSQTQAARDRITAALVGLGLVATSLAITILLQQFFGLTIIGRVPLPQAF